MQLVVLTALTLTAFAANSVLNRMGVDRFGMDPGTFAAIRVAAGVAVLWALVWFRGASWPHGRWPWRLAGAAALALYMVGFSQAYVSLDTGVGALLLFGGVQITMFAGALAGGDRLPWRRYAGAVLALIGLAVLVWPNDDAVLPVGGVTLMLGAAFGWGIYSLMGRSERDPLAATAANFALCLPMTLPFALTTPIAELSMAGVLCAVLAGGVMSALGYALWYQLLPQLGASRAAVAQLSVPVIAALGGWVMLSEPVGLRFAVAAIIVLGGIGWSLWPGRTNTYRQSRSNGS